MLRDLITDKLELAGETVRSCASPQFKAKLPCDCAFFKDKFKILKAKRKL